MRSRDTRRLTVGSEYPECDMSARNEQVPVDSPDITATIIRLSDGAVLVASAFNILVLTPRHRERLLLENAPWKEIRVRIETHYVTYMISE